MKLKFALVFLWNQDFRAQVIVFPLTAVRGRVSIFRGTDFSFTAVTAPMSSCLDCLHFAPCRPPCRLCLPRRGRSSAGATLLVAAPSCGCPLPRQYALHTAQALKTRKTHRWGQGCILHQSPRHGGCMLCQRKLQCAVAVLPLSPPAHPVLCLPWQVSQFNSTQAGW